MASPIPPRPRPSRTSRRKLAAGGAMVAVAATLGTAIAVSNVGRRDQQESISSTQAATLARSPAPTASTVSQPSSRSDLPLRGVPLQRPTALRLLVADAPVPLVLDVDRNTVEPIAGLPTRGDRGVSVLPVGKDALVLSYRFCDRCGPASSVNVVRRGGTVATPLGTALDVAASRDGQGAWILVRNDANRCAIREIGLDGQARRPDRPLSCRTDIVAELPAGLFVSSTSVGGNLGGSALLTPDGGTVRLAIPQVQPVAGDLVLIGADARTPLVLRDLGSGARRRLAWPSRRDYVLGEVTGDPMGPVAVVEFAKFSPAHRLDMWLLDTRTLHWQHVPGTPAHLIPKVTDVNWTADGRVVLLSGNVLGVWRPGEQWMAVGRVKAPKQPGSEFALW